jgi:hypothetical protein
MTEEPNRVRDAADAGISVGIFEAFCQGFVAVVGHIFNALFSGIG